MSLRARTLRNGLRILREISSLALIGILLMSSNAFADVKITNVDNLPLPGFSGSGSVQATDNVCVYSSGPSNSYTIEVVGPGPGGAFELPRNSGGASLLFTVDFKEISGSYVSLTANSPSAPFSNADTSSQTCSGGTNATIRVLIPEVNLLSSPAGTYSGDIFITVTPV